VSVIRGTDLQERGFGGLWGVGKAAPHPPALVILEHCPEGVSETSPSVCMVGKGIVFDTGGLSIKPTAGMCGMKRDMGGAAGILGAFRALALSGGCGKRVAALLCLAENSVGTESTRNDDILTLYSGKTVEINNTDAEGRL
jgi:probable aminopeptidase NPEPL1